MSLQDFLDTWKRASKEESIDTDKCFLFLKAFERNLFDAVKDGNTETVQKLLECSGLDANKITDEYGRTLLHWAAKHGQTELVEKLVTEYKVDIDAKDNDEQTALHWAALYGHSETFEKLIDLKANVKARCKDGRESLYYASKNCSEQAVEKALKASANPAAITKNGWHVLNPQRVNNIKNQMLAHQYA